MTEDQAVNLIGKRYYCNACGSELICTKGGPGRLTCHGVRMPLLAPKALPATD